MMNRRRLLLKLAMLGLIPSNAFAVCRPTEPNALGPYYRRDAPFRSAIAAPDEAGQLLEVTGKVLRADDCGPLAGAVVDVWHANEAGRYYDVGSDAGTEPRQFRLRGRVRTNRAGQYAFETILPGTYGSRPKHIHYVIQHPDAAPLVTQLYFEGDPRLASDFLARDSLVRPLERIASDGLRIRFDITLGRRTGGPDKSTQS